jgi:hypothetical protein
MYFFVLTTWNCLFERQTNFVLKKMNGCSLPIQGLILILQWPAKSLSRVIV